MSQSTSSPAPTIKEKIIAVQIELSPKQREAVASHLQALKKERDTRMEKFRSVEKMEKDKEALEKKINTLKQAPYDDVKAARALQTAMIQLQRLNEQLMGDDTTDEAADSDSRNQSSPLEILTGQSSLIYGRSIDPARQQIRSLIVEYLREVLSGIDQHSLEYYANCNVVLHRMEWILNRQFCQIEPSSPAALSKLETQIQAFERLLECKFPFDVRALLDSKTEPMFSQGQEAPALVRGI